MLSRERLEELMGPETADELLRTARGEPVDSVTMSVEEFEEALDEKKRAALNEALDLGLAELDAGLGVRCSPRELMAEIHAELGMKRNG